MPPKRSRKTSLKSVTKNKLLRTFRANRSTLQTRRMLSRIGRFKNQIHHYCRGYAGGITITSTAANTQFFGYVFSPSSMVSPTDFTNLYDQYRINKIMMKFRLVNDPANPGLNSAGIVPRLFWCLDYDDATTPASLNELRERAKTKMAVLSPYRPVTIKWTPSVLVTGYESGVSSMYMPKFKQWVDCSDFGTQFFGIKFAIDQFAENITPFAVEIEVKYYFSCKNVR